ncbi:MAG TPA: DUF1800 domain-containing protein [Candidatus Dormibacteraeota bacterium]|nr:DUF1800 domain-containing protein [Candidatus Dormibacteraeota bacterium]
MRSRFVWLSALLLCVGLACAVPHLLAKKKDKSADSAAEQKRAVHALNRLTFGPRPGDVQQVMAMGVDRWIDQQLHPEKISDSAVESRLTPLRTLHMSSKEIMEDFPDQPLLKQVMDGKRPMPSDPARRAVYQVQVARLQEKQDKKQERVKAENDRQDKNDQKEVAAMPSPAPATSDASQGAKTAEELAAAAASTAEPAPNAPADSNTMASMSPAQGESSNAAANDASMTPSAAAKSAPADDAEARRREDRLYADLKIQGLIDLSPDERYKKVLAMSVDEQVAFADSLRGGKGQEFLEGLNPKQTETLLAMNNPQAVVVEELSQAKLLRAIYSERQLEEVMTDFWFNHFNVFVGKGPERLLLTNYEQEVIRPRAMGKFEDLLVATAKSPAMLFYLDNWMSVGPNSMQAGGGPQRPMMRPGPYGPYGRRRFPRQYPNQNPNARRKQNSGLNENYGRELLELHTLSVNGGYSQRDVTEVAKVFTGWTIDKPLEGMSFRFDPRMHEPGPKFVLGHRIKPKGEDEGREVLHMLATSKQTAHFISLKLAQRFVSDDPPPALVDRMAKTFEKKKGDIREVLSTLFHSPEFWADATYRAKVKTPLEFLASAVRATGANVDNALPLARQLNNMGMPLYGSQPPTGYSMKADTWVSSSALLNRMNFALALTSGKVHGVRVDVVQLAGGPPASVDATTTLSTMETKLLAADVSKQTHDSIVAQMEGPAKDTKLDPGKKPSQPKPPDASTIAGLLLGSPEFQRR